MAVLHARITADGRWDWPTTEHGLRRVVLQRFAGHAVEVVVRKPSTRRSLDLNAYWHAVPFRILGDHFGYELSEIKLVLLGECFGWRRDALSGRDLPLKTQTSMLTQEEGVYFTDWMVRWSAQEHGVKVPLPGELDER